MFVAVAGKKRSIGVEMEWEMRSPVEELPFSSGSEARVCGSGRREDSAFIASFCQDFLSVYARPRAVDIDIQSNFFSRITL